MFRRKTRRRNYNFKKQRQTENSPRRAESSQAEDPPHESATSQPQECPLIKAQTPEDPPHESATSQPQECPLIQAQTPEEPAQASTSQPQAKTSNMPPAPAVTTEVLEAEKGTLSKFLCLNISTVECQEESSTMSVAESVAVDEDSDEATMLHETSLNGYDDFIDVNDEWDWPSTPELPGSPMDDWVSGSQESPLNLTLDSSMAENYQQQVNTPNCQPNTTDDQFIPVDEMISLATQKKIRTTIWALFPNGPPPAQPCPPPVLPMRRPMKGDLSYYVYCGKRKQVPWRMGLNVFIGDKYGITSTTNCDEDEQCTPEKKARRERYGTSRICRSAFNQQSNEIVQRLKLYEKIDRLVGRTPIEKPVRYKRRPFSPLPSTSTDLVTIMKNDKHFRESFYYPNVDDDEELPEVVWETDIVNKEKNRSDLSSPLFNYDLDTESNNYSDVSYIEADEDTKDNNNDVIAMDEDIRENEFDKLVPKLRDYSDVEPIKEPEESVPTICPLILPSKPSNDICITTSPGVIYVEDYCASNILNPISTQASANSITSSVLRPSNTNATTAQAGIVIEVTDVLEPTNTSCHAPTGPPAWIDDVQFVCEERIERLNNSTIENLPDVQIGSYVSSESKKRKTKPKENLGIPCNTKDCLAIIDENTAPTEDNASNVNNENAVPAVNQVQQSDTGGLNSSPDEPTRGKPLGECPICLDNLQRGSMASTKCGHVFCLECIKESLKRSGKKCPTCRKLLKGIGYHQVFL